MNWVDRLLAFLEKNLPWFLLGLQSGQKLEQGPMKELKKENVNLKLQLESKENAEKIHDHNTSLGDDKLVDEILSSIGSPKGNPDDKVKPK